MTRQASLLFIARAAPHACFKNQPAKWLCSLSVRALMTRAFCTQRWMRAFQALLRGGVCPLGLGGAPHVLTLHPCCDHRHPAPKQHWALLVGSVLPLLLGCSPPGGCTSTSPKFDCCFSPLFISFWGCINPLLPCFGFTASPV